MRIVVPIKQTPDLVEELELNDDATDVDREFLKFVLSEWDDQAIEEVKRLTGRLIVGAPFDEPSPFMGPVIDMQAADQLTESFLYLMSNGGKALTHMKRPRDGLPHCAAAGAGTARFAGRPPAGPGTEYARSGARVAPGRAARQARR